MTSSQEKTRADLIQIEYELYSDMVRERRAKNQEDPDLVAQELLDIDSNDDLAGFNETTQQIDMDALLLLLAEMISKVPSDRIRGANPTRPPT